MLRLEKDIIFRKKKKNKSHFLTGHQRLLLVLDYMELGTLTHYLKQHTLDWRILCRMCRSLASGLSHLHCSVSRGGKCLSFSGTILEFEIYEAIKSMFVFEQMKRNSYRDFMESKKHYW